MNFSLLLQCTSIFAIKIKRQKREIGEKRSETRKLKQFTSTVSILVRLTNGASIPVKLANHVLHSEISR